MLVLSCRLPGPADAAPRLGMSIRIALPITGKTVGRVERFVDRALERAETAGARPVLIFKFEVPPEQAEFVRQSEFTAALRLARLLSGERLAVARTVAYVPESIPGHAVLVVLACDEIMMPGDARIGPVGVTPETIGPTERSAYKEIAQRRKTVPAEVALWLLDPAREVLVVEAQLGREYVTPKALEELRKRQTIKSSEPLGELVDGPPGQFSGEEARRLGFVSYLADSHQDVAKALKLPPEAVEEDPSLIDRWRAVRVDLKGPISAETVKQAQRLIEDEIRLREVNFVCLWIDSPGGSPADSIALAGFLGSLDPGQVRTVAYIPSQARSDAALVALACDQVLIRPDAELGGSGAYELSEEDVKYAKQSINDPDGPWKTRSWSLVAAMIDPKLEVFRCTRPGEVGYFCDEELKELAQQQPGAPKWHKGQQITRPGKPLLVDGRRAQQYGLANRTVDNFAELKEHYVLQDDPTLLEPGWADFLIEALASPGVAAFLLMIAFVALYAELNAPGIGLGGFLATVCFLLFFWSHYLGGTAGWLEVTLFLAGVACLLLEVFVLPGFGVFGLGGGCLVLVSLILASQTFVLPRNEYQFGQLRRSLLTVAGAGVGIAAAAVFLRRWLPSAPIFNRMFLRPPAGEEAEQISRRESLVDLDGFVGARGTTTTQLTPSGKARFGDMLLDVITDGDLVPRGAEIEVVEVHGNRVIVKIG